jgi:hypothetical protein
MHPKWNYPPAANVLQGRIHAIICGLEVTLGDDQGKPV